MQVGPDTILRVSPREDSTIGHRIHSVYIETPLTIECQPVPTYDDDDIEIVRRSWGVWDSRVDDWATLPGQVDAGKDFDTYSDALAFVADNLAALLG